MPWGWLPFVISLCAVALTLVLHLWWRRASWRPLAAGPPVKGAGSRTRPHRGLLGSAREGRSSPRGAASTRGLHPGEEEEQFCSAEQRAETETSSEAWRFSYCSSPDCVRCGPLRKDGPGAGDERVAAMQRKLSAGLRELARSYGWTGMRRLHKAVKNQHLYLQRCGPPRVQAPTVLYLPDLPTEAFLSAATLRHDVGVMEAAFPALRAEMLALMHGCNIFNAHAATEVGTSSDAADKASLWRLNAVPAGSWATLFLVNEGRRHPRALAACPAAAATLARLRKAVRGNALGSALYSVLAPGTRLPPHHGATNTRVRAHLGLLVPQGAELVVAGQPRQWEEGKCLVFDDSFLHSVTHSGTAEDGPRGVLMVDLWHPNLTQAERRALDFLFAVGQ